MDTTELQGGGAWRGLSREHQPRFGQCLGAMVSMVTMTSVSGEWLLTASFSDGYWKGCPPGEPVCYGHIQMDRPASHSPHCGSVQACLQSSDWGWLMWPGWSSPLGVTSKVGMTQDWALGHFLLGTDLHKVLPSHPIPGLEGPAALGRRGASGGGHVVSGRVDVEPRLPVESIKKK